MLETDQAYAEARAQVKYLDKRLKVVKSHALLNASGTVAEKEAESYTSAEYQEALKQYKNAVLDMETMGVKRETIALKIEVWRTRSANRRTGNI